ncbi:MAG: hypothetical protein ACI9HY_003506, partial [Planctomycetaceae bacterium]
FHHPNEHVHGRKSIHRFCPPGLSKMRDLFA